MDFLAVFTAIILVCVSETRVLAPPRHARISLAERTPSYYYNNIDGKPGTYSYGYDVSDPSTGNTQFRNEERYANGTVVGSYGYIDTMGKPHRYRYIADERGYRVMKDRPKPVFIDQAKYTTPSDITTEPSITWTRPSKKKNPNRNNYNYQYLDNNLLSYSK